jgi:cytochrome c
MAHRLLVRSAAAAIAVATTTASFAQYPSPSPGFDILLAEQVAGQKVFTNHCAACHGGEKSSTVGPSLHRIVGRPAASLKDFPYSEALRKSGLTWTEDNLQKWIADSAQMVPNTLMPHVSISDRAEQIYLIAYLKTF